jgi:hypothetical protein
MMAVEIPVDGDVHEPLDPSLDASVGWFSENSGSGRLVRAVSGLGGWFSGDAEQQRAHDEAASAAKRKAHAENVESLVQRFARSEGMTRDTLARFATARGDRLDDAVVMVERHLEWRANTFPIDETAAGVAEAVSSRVFRRVGLDKRGRPVLLFAANIHKASEARNLEDIISAVTLVVEAAVREANGKTPDDDARSQETDVAFSAGDAFEDANPLVRQSGFLESANFPPKKKVFLDASPPGSGSGKTDSTIGCFSLIVFAPRGTELDVQLVRALTKTFQENYPERLHRLYALPTGAVTRVVWETVRPFLSSSVARKVILASAGRRPVELRDAIPMKTLREAIVNLDPMEHGEEDPWDAEEHPRKERDERDQ